MRTYSAALAAVVLSLWCLGLHQSPAPPRGPGAPSPGTRGHDQRGRGQRGSIVLAEPLDHSGGTNGRLAQRRLHHRTAWSWTIASIDTGNLDPGAFSAPMFLEATGSYHCTIHPVMVGTIKGQ